MLVFIVHMVGAVALDLFRIGDSALVPTSPDDLAAGLAVLANFGHHGVDLFFIISGFLMMKVSMHGGGLGGSFEFLFRRFLRIYPAFAASLMLGTLIRVGIFEWPFKPGDFALNFLFLNAIPSLGVTPYNFVSWSLGYEFAFYFLVPLICLSSNQQARLVISVLFLLVGFLLIPGTYLRFNGLLVGAVIGCLSDEFNRRWSAKVPLIPLVLAYFAAALAWVHHLVSIHVYLAVFLPVSAALLIKITFNDNFMHRFFSMRWFGFLGNLSYSFYLWHTVCISLVLKYALVPLRLLGPTPEAVVAYVALSFLLSLVVSAASYYCFERWYFARKRPAAQAA